MKSVLLYSGGLDSELYRLMLKPDILLYIKSNVSYTGIELKALPLHHNLIVVDAFDFKEVENPISNVVPQRNLYYYLKAFEHGDIVYVGATYYDSHADKAPQVLNAVTQLMKTYRKALSDEPYVTPKLLAPYRSLTKGELIRKLLRVHPELSEHIKHVRTCYSPTSIKGCGVCKSCQQKALALAANAMYSPELFDTPPHRDSTWTDRYLSLPYITGTDKADKLLREIKKLQSWK